MNSSIAEYLKTHETLTYTNVGDWGYRLYSRFILRTARARAFQKKRMGFVKRNRYER